MVQYGEGNGNGAKSLSISNGMYEHIFAPPRVWKFC